jgi:hypothetical protein
MTSALRCRGEYDERALSCRGEYDERALSCRSEYKGGLIGTL